MKKMVALLLCALMMLGPAWAANAEPVGDDVIALTGAPAPERAMDALRVGTVTHLSGNFFTDMWGNNTADMDIRSLVHGYGTVAYNGDGNYELDQSVLMASAVSDDQDGNRTYTFALAKDLRYNDGTPITAADYVFSALLVSDPRMTDLGAVPGALEQILGYRDDVDQVRAGDPGARFAGVRLLDASRFSLTIDKGFLPYFYELALVSVEPYPISVIAPGVQVEDDGTGARLGDGFTRELLERTVLDPETGYRGLPLVSAGPYRLLSYDRDAHVAELERNALYKGNFEGKLPTVQRLTVVPADAEKLIAQLQSGELDLVNKVSDGARIAEGQAARQLGALGAANYLRSGLSFLSFACEAGSTRSAAVRKAIGMCADPDRLTAEFLQGYGLVAYAYYGYGQWMATGNDDVLLSLSQYSLNVNAAVGLLEADGWTLGEDGAPYDEDAGGVRCRRTEDGALERLAVRFAYPENTAAAAAEAQILTENMARAGFELTCDPLPFDELLRRYYRQVDREYDMFFMATNFALVFDPYYTFSTDDAHQGVFNTTGIRDDELMRLADDMRHTAPQDAAAYIAKWQAFQVRFMEVAPLIPLYSNIYFDFFRPDLHGYTPSAHWSFGNALLYASLGDEQPTPPTVTVTETEAAPPPAELDAAEDGEMVIID